MKIVNKDARALTSGARDGGELLADGVELGVVVSNQHAAAVASDAEEFILTQLLAELPDAHGVHDDPLLTGFLRLLLGFLQNEAEVTGYTPISVATMIAFEHRHASP